MRVSILKTDGGPHSPGKWATATAGQIIEIAASASADQEAEGRRLELQIIDILEKYHSLVQESERNALETKGSGHLDHYHNPNIHVNVQEVVNEIVTAGRTTQWAPHFENQEVVNHIYNTIATDMATSMHIERQYHCDRNPNDEVAQSYKNTYHKGGYVS